MEFITTKYRLGVLIPSSNTSVEEELGHTLPKEVSLHSSRLSHLSGVEPKAIEAMVRDVERASTLIASAGMDLLVLFATIPSLFHGKGFDEKIAKRMEELTGTKTITTSTAMLEALNLVGTKKLVLGTPFINSVNDKIVHFLESNGFEVLLYKGLGIEDNLSIGRLPPQSAFDLAIEIDQTDADTVLLACTNWRTLPMIESIESHLNKPVITTTQASLKAILTTLSLPYSGISLGKLFQKSN